MDNQVTKNVAQFFAVCFTVLICFAPLIGTLVPLIIFWDSVKARTGFVGSLDTVGVLLCFCWGVGGFVLSWYVYSWLDHGVWETGF